MKSLLIKIFSLIAFLGIVTTTTLAFIHDSEKSDSNSFVAGTIDLQIDSDCTYEVCEYDSLKLASETYCPPICHDEICSGFGNWDMTNLTTEKFFDFTNLDLGDNGEDTISYHVSNNEAFGCFSLKSKFGEDCSNCQLPETTILKQQSTQNLEPSSFELPESGTELLTTGGLGNCATNAGYDAECVHKIDWQDFDKTKTYTTTNGIINVVFIKAGTTCYKYTQNTTTGCYSISGIGTSTVVITENWSTQGEKGRCKDISHTEYVICKDPLAYLKFFSWHDDGDNIFEPGYPSKEIKIFGPVPIEDFTEENLYTLADPTTEPLSPGVTKYIGLAWCIGEMNIDYTTGEITCSKPNTGCFCENSEGKACLDIEFYIEQTRHNSNFSCE